MRNQHSNWREDLREVADIPSSEPETETKSERKIDDKKVSNKIVINPVMKEAFAEIGAVVLEVAEIEEESDCDDKEKKKRDIENLQNDKDTKEGRKPGKLKENNTATQLADVDRRIATQKLKRAQLERKAAKSEPKTDDVNEGSSVPDQLRLSNQYFKNRKPKSAEKKREEDKIKAQNYAANAKNRPDPYKSRAGESD